MRNIQIEIIRVGMNGRNNTHCVLRDAKTGDYIHTYLRLKTAEKKANEFANGGKVTLRFI